jgi:hypothetical protein
MGAVAAGWLVGWRAREDGWKGESVRLGPVLGKAERGVGWGELVGLREVCGLVQRVDWWIGKGCVCVLASWTAVFFALMLHCQGCKAANDARLL